MAEGIYKKSKKEHRVDALERTLRELDLKEVHDSLYKRLEQLVFKSTEEIIIGNKAELEEVKSSIKNFYFNVVLNKLIKTEYLFITNMSDLQESNKKIEDSFVELKKLLNFALLPWYRKLWYRLIGKKVFN